MPRKKGQKCPPGCQCGLHTKPGVKCPPGCDCGRHTAVRHGPSPETAAKISEALKGRKRGPLSEETKAKIGEAHRGRKHSEEFREECRQRQLGTGVGFYYDAGYRLLTKQYDHPLSNDEGIVAEHRLVLYDDLGPGSHPCRWCGDLVSWGGGDGISVDHLNGIKDDNRRENLVSSCRECNRIGMRLGKRRRVPHPCERCGQETINVKYCSRQCANVR